MSFIDPRILLGCVVVSLATLFWVWAALGVRLSLGAVSGASEDREAKFGGRGISIIVPARNAEHELEDLIASLRRQALLPQEVIIVDDGSTDSTPLIASRLAGEVREFKIKYFRVDSTPSGWAPKNWASFLGFRNSSGDIMVFIDSDVSLTSPDSIKALINGLGGKRIVSAMPSFRCLSKVCEALETVLTTLILGFKGFKAGSRPGWFFGCCWAVTREAYEELGTHSAFRECVVEEVCIASEAMRRRLEVRVIDGRGLFATTWHEGLAEGLHAVSRLALAGSSRKASALSGLIVASSYLIPPLSLVVSLLTGAYPLLWVSIAASTALIAANSLGAKVNGFSPLHSLTSPITGFLVGVYMALSFRGKVTWRGRVIEVR
ncbi:MAG: glycosyltransferase family 2 protein [Desulfurococcales archaeon]|nr:glycosyltransferase family 2 protein [Desulfurococcales archaeon]